MSADDFADILFNTSTQVLIENPEAFLKGLNIEYFEDKKLISQIVKELSGPSVEKIPVESIFAEVYCVGKWCIKVVNLCTKGVVRFLQQQCTDFKLGGKIFLIPRSYDNKIIVLAPNYISETIIGILLGRPELAKYTTAFPEVKGFQIDRKKEKTYTVMERLKPIEPYLEKNLRRPEAVPVHYMIFQMAIALNAAQKLYRYTHYDFHPGNYLAKAIDPNIVYVYSIPNGKYVYTLFPFDTKIIDFGFNRMEIGDFIITPKLTLFNPYGQTVDLLNFYNFDPYYDLFTIIEGAPYQDLHHRYQLLYIYLKLEERGAPFNVEVDETDDRHIRNVIDRELVRISGGKWRPNPNNVNKVDDAVDNGFGDIFETIPPCTPEEFIIKLSNAFQGDEEITRQNLLHTLKVDGIAVFDTFINLTGREGIKEYKLFPYPKGYVDAIPQPIKTVSKRDKSVMISPWILVMPEIRGSDIKERIPLEKKEYNRTIPKISTKKGEKEGNIENQHIHFIMVNQLGIIQEGYRYHMDCCRIDIRELLRRPEIESGIAINASFYKFDGDFSPLGYFHTPDMESNNPIPEMYKKDYGMVGINKAGLLEIEHYLTKEEADKKFDQVVSVGPMLVWDNKPLMTSEKLRTFDKSAGIYKYQCKLDAKDHNLGEEPRVFGDRLPNCNRISPGEFSHSANPNPRTVIATSDNLVGFYYIEGRLQRGFGMDLAAISDWLVNNLVRWGWEKAINLDGGGSSQMVWKQSGNDFITQANPKHDYSYPVGSVISLTKMAS